jgi:hypothetical protein
MKHALTLLFVLTIGYSASAQQSRTSSTHTNISDDDKTLSIQVDGLVDGKSIKYDRRFNVKDMSIAQKDALKQRVFDSLGIGEPPAPPKPPVPPSKSAKTGTEEVTIQCESCTGKMRLEIHGSGFTMTHESDSKKDKEAGFPLTAAMRPGEYRLMYWQNKVLQIQSTFTVKADDENVVKVK